MLKNIYKPLSFYKKDHYINFFFSHQKNRAFFITKKEKNRKFTPINFIEYYFFKLHNFTFYF